MPKSAPPPPLSPLAQQLDRLDKASLCGVSDRLAFALQDPRVKAKLEGMQRRLVSAVAPITFAIRAARAELDAHTASSKTAKGGK